MFTWICPTCGREVPPSYKECPDCAAKAKGTPAGEPAAASPPPVAQAPPRPRVIVRHVVPGWLVTILVAMGLAAAAAGGYYWLKRPKTADEAPPASAATVPMESPTQPGAVAGAPHRLAKYIEVAGIRIIEEKKKPRIKCLLVNHSQAELGEVSGTVSLRAGNGSSAPISVFPFKVTSLGPWESREIEAPLETTLRVYEIPDWQFLRAEVRLTSQ